MQGYNLEDIFVKHLIKFDYDVSSRVGVTPPHDCFRIDDSIHYKALVSNDFSDYEQLIITSNQHEHSVELFRDLIPKVDAAFMEKHKIKLERWPLGNFKYTVHDGCHRLAIILYHHLDNNNYIPQEWVEIV